MRNALRTAKIEAQDAVLTTAAESLGETAKCPVAPTRVVGHDPLA